MNRELPLVSVVTPSYNKSSFIEETILSVRNQTYPHIQHIVVDGGSTDDTLDILRRYDDGLIWISEPDEGQSDAINKGWRMAEGEILAYLNADDTYMPSAVQTAVEYLAVNPDVGMVYADADFINEHGEVTRHYQVGEFDLSRILCSYDDLFLVPQPTVFFRKEVLDRVGYLDKNLHLTMDLDFWIRISLKFRIGHIPQILATMRFYPEAKSVSQYYRVVDDCLRVLDKLFRDPELPNEMRECKRQAYGAIHLRGGLGFYYVGQIGKARKHLIKALALYPAQFKELLVLKCLLFSLLGENANKLKSTLKKIIDNQL